MREYVQLCAGLTAGQVVVARVAAAAPCGGGRHETTGNRARHGCRGETPDNANGRSDPAGSGRRTDPAIQPYTARTARARTTARHRPGSSPECSPAPIRTSRPSRPPDTTPSSGSMSRSNLEPQRSSHQSTTKPLIQRRITPSYGIYDYENTNHRRDQANICLVCGACIPPDHSHLVRELSHPFDAAESR